MSGGKSAGGGVDLMQLSIGVWLVFFAALPLINRDRMRGGDLIAGTMVIALPKLTLLSDLVERAAQFTFSEQQLRAYGAFELQVLEELLRCPPTPAGSVVLRVMLCDKICHRTAGLRGRLQNQLVTFLRLTSYTAERAFLERGQLYGKSVPTSSPRRPFPPDLPHYIDSSAKRDGSAFWIAAALGDRTAKDYSNTAAI